MQVQDNKVVSIHYTLKDDGGEVIDSSDGREPLSFLYGVGNIIQGLESALTEKQEGEKVAVTVDPEEGYGEYRDELVQSVPEDALKDIDNVEVGMRLQAQTDHGPIPVMVTDVSNGQVTVDANHVLAGKRLHFDVSIEDVREATDEEIAQGQAAEQQSE